MDRGARKPEPPEEAPPARQRLQRHLSPADRRAVQVRLDLSSNEGAFSRACQVSSRGEATPNRAFDPAELDLRFVVNVLRRGQRHWWLRTPDGRWQREYLMRRDKAAA
jgi:hypothetical protein